uniref:Mono [ADP-ribose] polymerase PARP16-like n=1 Tax=Sinocyclocheilus rhinocerous TaxID=307959 RepID=A0A673HRM2_9TELE
MQPPLPTAAVRELVCSCLHRDPVAADLRCSLFVAAVQSYKRDSALRPFPPRYLRGEVKDFEELQKDVDTLPNVRDLVRLGHGDGDHHLALVHWVLASKSFAVKTLQKEEVLSTVFPLIFGYDLIFQTSLFGEGTYLTSDLSMAILYSPHGNGWRESVLGPLISCVALCEIIDHPDCIDHKRLRARNSEGGEVPEKYFVVTNNELLRVKYLLVYSQRRYRSRHAQGTSWLVRHHFAVMMGLYLLLLIFIGAFSSSAFQSFWHRMFR